GTWGVASTDPTPVARAHPSRQACSTGSSRGTGTAATAGTTVLVANVPVRSTGVRTSPLRRRSRPAAAGGTLHWRGSPLVQAAHVPHDVFQPRTTRSPTATVVTPA